MKIVQVVTQMEAGGAQRVAVLLAAALRERGHEAETWFLYQKRPAFSGVPGVRVLLDRRPSAAAGGVLVARLARALRASAPGAVITHTHYANVVGQVAARLAGVPTRIAVHQNPLTSYPRLARRADYLLGTGRTYSSVVAVSEAVARSAAAYPEAYRGRMRVVHNAVAAPAADAPPHGLRARYGLPEGAPLLVNVGRLARQKNQAAIVEALPGLPGVHLAIVGEGELRGPLQELCRARGVDDRVHFLGELPWEEGIAVARGSDAFVFPSLFEGMSLALMEAMALGLPVVAGDVPAIREALQGAGLLVAPTDADGLAAAAGRVLRDPALRARLSAASRRRAEDFSLQRMADGYERLLA